MLINSSACMCYKWQKTGFYALNNKNGLKENHWKDFITLKKLMIFIICIHAYIYFYIYTFYYTRSFL